MSPEWTWTELGIYVRLLNEWRNKVSALFGYSGMRIVAEIITDNAIRRRTTQFTFQDISRHPDRLIRDRRIRYYLIRLVEMDYLRERMENGKKVYNIRVPGSCVTLDVFMEIMSIE